MNNARRKQIAELGEELIDIGERIEDIRAAEEEAFDNLPESLQDGERGELMQDAMEHIQTALDSVNDAVYSLQEAQA